MESIIERRDADALIEILFQNPGQIHIAPLPLMMAISNHWVEGVEILLQFGAKSPTIGFTGLITAIQVSDSILALKMLEHEPLTASLPISHGDYPLVLAIKSGMMDVIAAILKLVPESIDRVHPFEASIRYQPKIFNFLFQAWLEYHSEVPIRWQIQKFSALVSNMPLIRIAAYWGENEIIQRLSDFGISVELNLDDGRYRSMLSTAIQIPIDWNLDQPKSVLKRRKDISTLRLVIRLQIEHLRSLQTRMYLRTGQKYKINTQSILGSQMETAFAMAITGNNIEAVILLLQLGISYSPTEVLLGYVYLPKYRINSYMIDVLKALGASTDLKYPNPEIATSTRTPLPEATVIEIRGRIYFETSLVQRLMLWV